MRADAREPLRKHEGPRGFVVASQIEHLYEGLAVGVAPKRAHGLVGQRKGRRQVRSFVSHAVF